MHKIRYTAADKAARYQELLPQIQALLAAEPQLYTAALANVAAVLKQAFGWLWVGFYTIDAEGKDLVLGPFQGPVACMRIRKGRGVCGQAWQQAQTLVVPDVDAHPDHIACSSLSRSEIVVPLFDRNGAVCAVLDADSEQTAAFDETDAGYLQQICALISREVDVPFAPPCETAGGGC